MIQNGCAKLVNVKNQDGITKILDMVPDLVSKFANKNSSKDNSEADEAVKKAAAEDLADKLHVAGQE